MKWIGQHIWSFISRFRNTIYIEKTPTTDNTSSNALVLMGDGEIRINPDLGGSGSSTTTHIHEDVRNDEGSALSVGDPVYAIGEVGSSGVIRVGKADASDANKMPAIGILDQNLSTNATGTTTLVGVFNTNISGFTGVEPGQVLYVANGGGLTNVKPSGESNLLQNVGIVLKTNEENTMVQGLQVTVVGRTNATPNLDHNAIFLGDSTNCSVATDAPMVSVITAANGTDAKAELGAIDLTSEVTGTLGVTNGGTGQTDLNNVRVGEASEALVKLGSGSSQHALVFIDNAGPTAGGSYETLEGNANLHYVPQTGKLTASRFNGNLEGDIYSTNGNNKVLDVSTDGSSAWFMGDIYANNGTSKILESGTDGTNATFTGNASSASILETARTIGGVSFDGSANINLPGVNTAGNQDTSGNAATATALETARTINGVSFDGTQNITVSTDVTLAGTPDYITISGQEITRNQIDLSTDVTGILPTANGGTGQTAIGGANTQVQYNNNGVLAGNSSFTFNTTGNKVTVGGFEVTDSTLIFSGISSTSTPESHVIGIDASGNLKKQSAASGGSPAGDGSANDKPIQFNDDGDFGANAQLYWQSNEQTLVSPTVAAGTLHFGGGDTTITRSAASTVKLGDGSTGFSDLQAGTITATLHSSVTGTTQSQGDNSTKIATTAYVDTAAEPAGDGTGTFLPLQFNNNGSFGAVSTANKLGWKSSTEELYAQNFYAWNKGVVLSDFTCYGNIELGNATDTTLSRTSAGTVAIEGKEIVTINKVRQQFNLSFSDDINTDEHWLSWRDQYEASTISSDLVDTNYLVPANGRVVAIYIRIGNITASASMTMKVYSQNAGFMETMGEEEAEAVSIVATGDKFEVFAFYFDDAEHFQAGDSIKVSIQTDNDTGGLQLYNVTAVLEFDYTQMGRTDSGELA